ncbi:MAG: hypothetical protein AVDCRST_MAG80-843 [uncultured Rubrobacteraceae bacterium]|uniref:Uncharacterized protein n=1 Tax=uncultured Rubrobacteraceae bacterium TaxID=349277 RepID=A0A6J4Q507_9ACTN|nr:MAG: hypothetical protein AVDCRST_MAG80-843 [uncultured Rubrobacteraceae bacterium]
MKDLWSACAAILPEQKQHKRESSPDRNLIDPGPLEDAETA